VWEVRVYVGRDPVTQRPKQISRYIKAGPRTKTGRPPKAVIDLERQLEVENTQGHHSGTTGSVGLLLDRYFEHIERKGLSPQTMRLYRRMARLYIDPALGKKQVRLLTAWDLDRLYAGMVDAGKKANTVRQVHVVVSGALGQAVKWGWCPKNVARMASLPTVLTPRIVPATAAEVQQLVEAAERRNPVLAALVMLAALTGARRGELSALRWTDVDLAAGTLRIARSMIDLPGRVEEKTTKTNQERTVALGEAGVQLLTLHRDQVLAWAHAGEVDVAEDAFIFSSGLDAATPIRPDSVTGFFRRVRDELGMKHLHLHSLRHFMATHLAARGDVGVRTLAGRLGNDPTVTLRVYSAFFPAADLQAADHVGRLLTPGIGSPSEPTSVA
jgi:integrase